MTIKVTWVKVGSERTLRLSNHISMAGMADAIQIAFGWLHMHDYRYIIGDDELICSARSYALGARLYLKCGRQVRMEYGYGNEILSGEVHRIELVDEQLPQLFPTCLSSKGPSGLEFADNLGGIDHVYEVARGGLDAEEYRRIESLLPTACGYHGSLVDLLKTPEVADINRWILEFIATHCNSGRNLYANVWVCVSTNRIYSSVPLRNGVWPSWWQKYILQDGDILKDDESIKRFLEGKCGEYIVANVGRDLVAWQSKGALISEDKMRAMYFAECKNPLNDDPWYVTAWLNCAVE